MVHNPPLSQKHALLIFLQGVGIISFITMQNLDMILKLKIRKLAKSSPTFFLNAYCLRHIHFNENAMIIQKLYTPLKYLGQSMLFS